MKYIFDATGPSMGMGKLGSFKPQNIKISNFELQKSFVPQKKAESMYDKDSARKKMKILAKEYFFF